MDTIIEKLTSGLNLNHGTTVEKLHEVESRLKVKFPKDYFDFMIEADGGEGSIGDNYLTLWKVDEIPELNEAYNIQEFFPSLVVFGSDGANEAFAFSRGRKNTAIMQVPFVGTEDDVKKLATSFVDFLKQLADGSSST